MNKADTAEFIRETIKDMYATCHTDKYGQVHKSNFSIERLFKERTEEVKEFVKEDQSMISIATYGGQFGTYQACSIEDNDLRAECNKILSTNESYRYATTH